MNRQVFQTNNTARWIRFRWTMRTLVFIASLFLASLIIMLFIDKSPSLPFRQDYKNIVTASKPFLQETRLSKEY